eukprot:TRINITY_DN16370_c0_g1_i1.p1 TRINITY_DN16370_c0_g1~~TRINITY_DN16370_c0_g1_i1.p1  ORF type:complete len:286 (-),score=4.53 TRINITY_DN16370_c0_g1_i1:92-949(-)
MSASTQHRKRQRRTSSETSSSPERRRLRGSRSPHRRDRRSRTRRDHSSRSRSSRKAYKRGRNASPRHVYPDVDNDELLAWSQVLRKFKHVSPWDGTNYPRESLRSLPVRGLEQQIIDSLSAELKRNYPIYHPRQRDLSVSTFEQGVQIGHFGFYMGEFYQDWLPLPRGPPDTNDQSDATSRFLEVILFESTVERTAENIVEMLMYKVVQLEVHIAAYLLHRRKQNPRATLSTVFHAVGVICKKEHRRSVAANLSLPFFTHITALRAEGKVFALPVLLPLEDRPLG